MDLSPTFAQEDDGRWIAEFEQVPGAMAYGATKKEAFQNALAIALLEIAYRQLSGNS